MELKQTSGEKGRRGFPLLIELYGIETFCNIIGLICINLLIELYGIETFIKISISFRKPSSFNRTIWNWNISRRMWFATSLATFNRTIWNWNSSGEAWRAIPSHLLIELYGIETQGRGVVLRPRKLLIELYGIETMFALLSFCVKINF